MAWNSVKRNLLLLSKSIMYSLFRSNWRRWPWPRWLLVYHWSESKISMNPGIHFLSFVFVIVLHYTFIFRCKSRTYFSVILTSIMWTFLWLWSYFNYLNKLLRLPAKNKCNTYNQMNYGIITHYLKMSYKLTMH